MDDGVASFYWFYISNFLPVQYPHEAYATSGICKGLMQRDFLPRPSVLERSLNCLFA